MKQVYIVTGIATSKNDVTNDKTLAVYPASNPLNVLSLSVDDKLKRIGFSVGKGAGKMPYRFDDIDLKDLRLTVSTPQTGVQFAAEVEVTGEVEDGETYTVILSKKGVGFNERGNYTYSVLAKGTDAEALLNELAKQINANSVSTGLKAQTEGDGLAITPVATDDFTDWAMQAADGLASIATVDVNPVTPPTLDSKWVADLVHQGIGDKGIEYAEGDGKEIYPAYPAGAFDAAKKVYTLRFAVGREAAKQRDEVVYQTVHLVDTTGAASTIESILGKFKTNE